MLSIADGSQSDGANVQQWSYNGSAQQQWKFEEVSDTDTQAPTKPQDLQATLITSNFVSVKWNASSDNVGVTGYDIFVNGVYRVNVSDLNYALTGLEDDTSYQLAVRAKDAAGNKSEKESIKGKTSEKIIITDKGFHTDGTVLLDANNNPFVIRGVNYAYAWQKNDYPAEVVIPAIKEKTGANAVRIPISNGTKFQYTTLAEVQKIVRLCEQNKMVAILEVQDPLGSDSYDDLQKAVDYWKTIKSAVIGHESTVIINIANEWMKTWEGTNWAEGYKKAIPQLREAGIKNTIMVDCAGYGQYPASIGGEDRSNKQYELARGAEVAASDELHNTMFSIHM